MRDFLDAIFQFIGSESLTDLEFDDIELVTEEYSQAVFDVLRDILEARDAVSSQIEKLAAYFLIKGTTVQNATKTPVSDVFIGAKV